MIWLVLISVVLVALVTGSLWGGVRAVQRAGSRAAAAAADRLRAGGVSPERIRPARCLGHSLPEVPALRGAGALALDRGVLRFQLALPDRALEIALGDVVATTVVSSERGGAGRGRVVIERNDGARITLAMDTTELWPVLLSPPGRGPEPPVR